MRTWSAARTSLRGRTVEWASVFTLRSPGRSSRRLPRERRWRRNNCGVAAAVLLDDLGSSVTEASANSQTCDRCHRSSGVVHLPEQYVAILFSKVRLCLNTIPTMRAAFDRGANVVEFDIHPTTDGRFAVFHDRTLECKTNESGLTRTHTMKNLKRLDIGYGYTSDDGHTYPCRGKRIALWPSMDPEFPQF